MSLLADFQQKKNEMFQGILYYLTHATATPEQLAAMSEEVANLPEEGTAQFVRGFLDVLEQAIQGNTAARDEYLTLVVPPLKDAGLPLPMMGRAIAPMFGVVFAHLGVGHLGWLSSYAHEYSERFFTLWEGL